MKGTSSWQHTSAAPTAFHISGGSRLGAVLGLVLIGSVSRSVYVSHQVPNEVIPAVTASELVNALFLAVTDTVADFTAVGALDLDPLTTLDLFLLAASRDVTEFCRRLARNDKEQKRQSI